MDHQETALEYCVRFARNNPQVRVFPTDIERLQGLPSAVARGLVHWDAAFFGELLIASTKAGFSLLPARLFDLPLLNASRFRGCSGVVGAKEVLSMLAMHPLGGLQLLKRILLDEEMEALCASDVCYLWQWFGNPVVVEHGRALLQGAFVACTNSAAFWCFRKYLDYRDVTDDDVFQIGNVSAARWLGLECGHDLLQLQRRKSKCKMTPLHGARSKEVVSYLLNEGADVALLVESRGLAPPSVLRWVWELGGFDSKSAASISPNVILHEGVDETASMTSKVSLEYVRLLRDMDMPIPRETIVAVRHDQMLCALITYGYIPIGSSAARRIFRAPEWFNWTHFTHKLFDRRIHSRVVTALLALKRVCPCLPRDLRLRAIMEPAFEGALRERETLTPRTL